MASGSCKGSGFKAVEFRLQFRVCGSKFIQGSKAGSTGIGVSAN